MRFVRWVMAFCATALLLATPVLADPVGAATPPGNAGTQSDLAGCIYETSPAVAASGQQRGLHCDANGNLLSSATTTPSGTQNVNLTQVGSTAVVTGGVAGSQGVGGTSASGVADDASFPVKLGGVFLSTAPTILTGQRGNLQIGPRGGLGTSVLDNTLGAFQELRTYAALPTAGPGVLAAGLVSIFSATPSVLTDGQYGSANMTARHALQVAHVATDGVITAASGNVANANAVATLAAGGASKTTYITGFQCTASGSTIGLAVNLTVAGVITGTMTYTFVFTAGVLTEAPILNVSYPNPIPASALNTAITVTLPAGGTGNTNAACNAQGYQL